MQLYYRLTIQIMLLTCVIQATTSIQDYINQKDYKKNVVNCKYKNFTKNFKIIKKNPLGRDRVKIDREVMYQDRRQKHENSN